MEASSIQVDLGHLKVIDNRVVEEQSDIDARASTAVQRLVDELFQLPPDTAATEQVGFGRVVRLPAPIERLPREKPLPKHKRERFVWDETSQSWRPRHGGGKARPSIHSKATEWIIEDKEEGPPGRNPFRRRKGSPESRKAAAGPTASVKSTKATAKRDRVREAQQKLSERMKSAKDALDHQLSIAQRSTASMGTYDRRIDGERDHRQRGKSRAGELNTPSQYASERKRALQVADAVLQGIS
jgi:regulator of ribosome biosynthesis